MQQQMRARQNMDPTLERQLDEGEELLWLSNPIASSKNKLSPKLNFLAISGFMIFLGISALITVFTSPMTHPIAGMLFLFIGGSLFSFLGILIGIVAVVYKWSPQNTIYAITHQRIIIIHKGRRATTTISYGSSDLGPITCIERPDGSGDLIFVESGNEYGHTIYSSGQHETSNDGLYFSSGQPVGKFIGISDVREVEQLLRKTFK